MILIFSIVIAIMFGSGAFLMLKRDLVRVIIGMILIGNSSCLFIMSAALRRGDAPMLAEDGPYSDPLVQAMTLTAIVIGFGTAALALSLVYRVYDSHLSVDVARLSQAEEAQAELDDQATAARLADEAIDEEIAALADERNREMEAAH